MSCGFWIGGSADAVRAGVAQVAAARRQAADDVDGVVRAILDDVRARGDAAVREYTERFDRLDLTGAGLRIGRDEIEAARRQASNEEIDALEFAAERIRAYHARQVPEPVSFEDGLGVRLGWRWSPIPAVGIYVPGGTAAYPSSVLMNALPAKLAGVPRVAMAVPTPDGALAPLVLVAAAIAGIDEIYRIGGAQAVGALAFGTETIAPVAKIVGPGNAYVAAAKRMVYGTVGIDSIAGPSEVLVVADARTPASWVAADLLAQAEHDPSAQSIFVTDDEAFARAVVEQVDRQLDTLPRADIARASWTRFGAVVVVPDLMEDAPAVVDAIAPEHLELAVDDPQTLAARITHAGAIFLGRHTPEAIGDYVGGSNHVLPTNGAARFSSGLSVLDFMKRTSLLECDARSLGALAAATRTLAHAEGLDAHARSVTIRGTRAAGPSDS